MIQGYENLELDDILKIYKEDEIEVSSSEKVPRIPYDFENTERMYYPDIFISKDNKIIEVKSCYTFLLDVDKNLTKKDYVKNLGYEFEFLIYDKDGYRLNNEEIINLINLSYL